MLGDNNVIVVPKMKFNELNSIRKAFYTKNYSQISAKRKLIIFVIILLFIYLIKYILVNIIYFEKLYLILFDYSKLKK